MIVKLISNIFFCLTMFFFNYIIIFKLNIVLYLIPQLFVISFHPLGLRLSGARPSLTHMELLISFDKYFCTAVPLVINYNRGRQA